MPGDSARPPTSCGGQHPVPRDERLLFLLSVFPPPGMYQRHGGQDPSEPATGHGAVHPFAGDQVLLPDVPPLLRNGGQGAQTDGDVPPAHRLCPHLRAVVLFLKRAAAHFPVGHPACHAAVRLRRHRGLHLPPDRRHVGRPPSGKPADG